MKGSIHFRKDSGWWFVKWYDIKKKKAFFIAKYRGERMYHRKIAEKLLATMQADQETGVFRIEKFTGEQFTDVIPYLSEWLNAVKQTLTPATVKDYENSIRNHLAPFFRKNNFQLHEIQFDVLVMLLNSIKRTGKGKLNVMYCLHACLKYAWKSRRIPEVPAFPEKRLYQIQEPSITWLPEDRQMAIIYSIPAEHQPIFWWLKYHLRRPAEACVLKWEDWDHENEVFIIRRSESARREIERTKTGVEHIIPAHSEFVKIFMAARRVDVSPYIFVNPRSRKAGKRYTNDSLNVIWHKACRDVGESIDLYSGLKHSSCSQYIYVWLIGNPCFEGIPKGYVIHHLDHDPTNDDITNLVLMQKHHHAAHHWKSKTIKPEINVKIQYDSISRTGYSPIKKPSIHKRKDVDPEWWTVSFRETINGKNERTFVSKDFDGNRFRNREDAESFASAIWRE